MKYPFLNLADVNEPYSAALKEAAARVIDSGRYVGGEENAAFEAELAKYTGTEYCVGVSNGLDALRLIFRAYIERGRLQPGDEVIVPRPQKIQHSTLNIQHSTFKKDESEHLENNSSDSHQHSDRYRYYARSNELHGIKTKTTAHLNMRRVVIFVLPRIPVMKGQSH